MRKIYLLLFMFVAFSGSCYCAQTINASLTTDALSYCQGSTVTFTVTLTLSGGCSSTTFDYKVFKTTDIVNPVAAILASTSTTQTLTLSNVLISDSGNYYCTVSDGLAGCTDALSTNKHISVNAPSAVGTVSLDQTICTGSSPANMTISSSNGTVQWQRADDFAFTSNIINLGTNSNTLTGAQVGNLAANKFFRATVTNGVCPSINSEVITVDITVPSAVGVVSANQSICTGSQPANMTILNATGTVQWKVANDLAFTSNVTNVGTNSTTLTGAQVGNLSATQYFRATVTNGPCASINSGIITVTVDVASAVGAVSPNQTICSGSQPVSMTIASATGTVQWKRADDAGFTTNVTNVGTNSNTLTGAQAGTLTMTRYFRATVTSGACSSINSAVIIVTVDPASAVGAVSANQTICSGSQPANLTIVSATGTVQWKVASDLAFTNNVTNVGTNSNTLTGAQVGNLTATRYFRATVTNGTCTGINSAVITVSVDAPSALGAVSANQTICTGSQPANMTLASSTGTVQWKVANDLAFTSNVTNVGTNSNTLTGAQVGNLNATRYFRATVTNGTCASINSGIITVSITATVGNPNAITISNGTEPTCQLTNGTATTTYNTSAQGSTSFNWSLSNANAGVINASSGQLTWANGFTGTVNIQVTANGCNGPSAQIIRTVLVNPNPTATFTINDDKQCQTGNSFVFTSTSTVTGPSQITNLSWNFDTLVPSTGSGSPKTVTFTNKGVVPVVLTVTTDSGCVTSSSSQTITIFPMPDSSFTFPGTICQKDAVTFTQTNNGTFAKTWDWGDLTSPQTVNTPTVIHAYQTYSQTTYTVILTVTSNVANGSCTNTKTQNVTVYPLPNVNFTINDDKQCLHSNAFTFTDASTIYTTSGSQLQTYSWNYGDDSLGNGQVVSHSYLVDGLKNVKHTVVSDKGCSLDTTIMVTVDRSPIITITTPPTTICGGGVSTLTTNASGVSNPTYLWSYNSQITPNLTIAGAISATATAEVTTNYSVTVTDVNQCTGSANQDITVKPAPVGPVIEYDRTIPLCIGAIGRQFYVSNFQTSNNITYSWSAPQATRISGADKQYCNIDSPISTTPPFHVIVTASNNFGCSRSTDSVINISGSVAPKGEVMRDGSTNTLICMSNTPKSYQWGYDTITTLKETEVAGETYQDFLVGSNPDSSSSKRHYWVRITDDGGCQSKIYYQKPYRQSSIREKETTVSVFPNPFENTVNINLKNFMDPTATYEVFDIQGRLLKQQTEDTGSGMITVNTTDWQSGLYILKLQVGSTLNKTIRIVKQ